MFSNDHYAFNLLITASGTEPDADQLEVYVYGLECLLNTGATIFILFVWGLITNTFLETSCWIITFSILRHHSGGLHAPTQFSCITSSCLLGISNCVILKFISYQTVSTCFIGMFCITICVLYAPADTSKYELSEVVRWKEKFSSLLILTIGFLVAFILKNSISISIVYSNFCTCILILIKVFIRKVKS